MKKQWITLALAGGMALMTAFPSLASFNWAVADQSADYVGTAKAVLKDWEGNTYEETAPVVVSGAIITFEELDAAADYYIYAYDASGNPIPDFGGKGIAGGTINKNMKFQYKLDWDSLKKAWNSSFGGRAGIFEIGAYDVKGGGVWQQKFIIDGACNAEIISEKQVLNASADAYQWKQNSTGWWVEKADGTYLTNGWYQSPASGLWYYMGEDGYMLTDTTTPDGFSVNSQGVWVKE